MLLRFPLSFATLKGAEQGGGRGKWKVWVVARVFGWWLHPTKKWFAFIFSTQQKLLGVSPLIAKQKESFSSHYQCTCSFSRQSFCLPQSICRMSSFRRISKKIAWACM